MLQQGFAAARPGQIDGFDFADFGVRAVGHHHHPVCQQDGLIDIMGDHNGGDMGPFPDFHQHFLQFPAGQRIQHAERFIQQQQFGRQGKGAGDADPLLHAVGHVSGFFA